MSRIIFSVVRDAAKYIPELTVGKITTTSIDAVHVDGKMTEHTLIGYAPITEDLLAIPAGRTIFLNNAQVFVLSQMPIC